MLGASTAFMSLFILLSLFDEAVEVCGQRMRYTDGVQRGGGRCK